MIRAPAIDRIRIPAAIRPGLAEPLALTRIGITRQPQQCPAIPIWLFPRAAITLATREPWSVRVLGLVVVVDEVVARDERVLEIRDHVGAGVDRGDHDARIAGRRLPHLRQPDLPWAWLIGPARDRSAGPRAPALPVSASVARPMSSRRIIRPAV